MEFARLLRCRLESAYRDTTQQSLAFKVTFTACTMTLNHQSISQHSMFKSVIPLLHNIITHSLAPSSTIAHILHSPILTNMNVQPLRSVVHSAHATGLKHAVLLGEILLGKRLP